jgi:hypothetical protein
LIVLGQTEVSEPVPAAAEPEVVGVVAAVVELALLPQAARTLATPATATKVVANRQGRMLLMGTPDFQLRVELPHRKRDEERDDGRPEISGRNAGTPRAAMPVTG